MQWTDEVRLETPEQIDVNLELAGLGTRFVAQLYDWIIKILLSAVLVILALVCAGLLGYEPNFERVKPLVLALVVGGVYLLWLGFDIYYEATRNGQTPGKRHAGIRVIRDGGAPLDFQAAAVRNLLGLADYLPSFYVLGAIIILLTPRRQRLGDLAAGTIVVRERTLAAPAETAEVVQRIASEEYAFTAQHLAGCSANDRTILRSFLQRLESMEPASRDRLALQLANTFLQKTGYQPAQPIHSGDQATVFLASLLRDLEEQSRRG